jgi:hypothetical protein
MKMMFEYLDGLYQSATDIGAMIFVLTTCVVIIYLLFTLSPIIENLIQKDTDRETVIVDNKEIHIHIKNRTYEIKFNKLKRLFWWAIGISYVIAILISYSIIVVPFLVIIAILYVRKVIKAGPIAGIRSVLRIVSPK